MGTDVLLNQLLIDEPRVKLNALNCISYSIMNGLLIYIFSFEFI